MSGHLFNSLHCQTTTPSPLKRIKKKQKKNGKSNVIFRVNSTGGETCMNVVKPTPTPTPTPTPKTTQKCVKHVTWGGVTINRVPREQFQYPTTKHRPMKPTKRIKQIKPFKHFKDVTHIEPLICRNKMNPLREMVCNLFAFFGEPDHFI